MKPTFDGPFMLDSTEHRTNTEQTPNRDRTRTEQKRHKIPHAAIWLVLRSRLLDLPGIIFSAKSILFSL
jgi:hypothetical protein